MRSGSERVAAGLLSLLLTGLACAENLSSVYRTALREDPAYLKARVEYDSARELLPQARAGMLPELQAQFRADWHSQEIQRADFDPGGNLGSIDFQAYDYGLNLRQPLYRRDRMVSLRQAESRLLEAEVQFEIARQDLALRAAEAYFDLLARQEELGFTRSLQRSLERQLDQARQRLEVGLGTITDVEEAKAGYDLAVARGIQAGNEVEISGERLRMLLGAPAGALYPLSEDFPLRPPTPRNAEDWERIALDHSPEIRVARHGLAVSTLEIEHRRSGHYPTMDLVGAAGFSSTGGRFGQTDSTDIRVGMEFQLPLYQGGGVAAATRRALGMEQSARHDLEQARRRARRQTRESYLNTLSAISRIQALRQAVVSSQTALDSTRAGFEVGTRTSVDVVEAERTLSEARRDYALARYDYLLASLRLQRAAGILSVETFAEIDHWLEASAPAGHTAAR